MLLQVLITRDDDMLPELLSGFMEAGIHGSTVVDCEGALQIVGHSNMEDFPLFGSLRQFLNPHSVTGKMVLTVLSEKRLEDSRKVIHRCIGDLSKPGTGIVFTIEIGNVEGYK